MTRPPRPLPWLAALLALYLAAPFVAGAAQLARADWASVEWRTLGRACAVSLGSATLATALIALTGIPLGYLLARATGRGMALLGFLVQLPLALPPLASGVLLLFLLGYASPLGRLAQGLLTDSFTGIVLAEAFVAAPFLIIAARSAFAGLDPVLEEVAATLGHHPASVFLRISLPLAWRGILAGLLLAWLRAFGEFGATVMVAYHPYSLPVYTYVAFGSQGLPAMLPVLLPTLAASLAVMAASLALGRAARRHAPPPRPSQQFDAVAALAKPSLPRRQAAPAAGLAIKFHRALEGFTLDVEWQTRATRLAILGASGSGKSLTLRLICGLDRASPGRLHVAGQDFSSRAPERRHIAYVPQNYGLFPHMTVSRQLRFPAGCDPRLTEFWCDRLGLRGLENRVPAMLSLGQQQRVALARALCRPAGLLLLDEPLSALDAPLRTQLRRDLRDLQTDIEATTLLVTHDPEEAFQLADEVLLLDAGRVLQSGAIDAVWSRPVSALAARLLGADNFGTGVAAAPNLIDIGDGICLQVAGPPLPVGARLGWAGRAECIRIEPGGRYPAWLNDLGPTIAGRCFGNLQIGGCLLRVLLPGSAFQEAGACRVSIDPSSVQVWAETGSHAKPR